MPNLIKIVLSPLKADIQSAAVHALIRIAKPAIKPLVSVLQGTDKEPMYDETEASKDASRIANVSFFPQFASRLEGRAP